MIPPKQLLCSRKDAAPNSKKESNSPAQIDKYDTSDRHVGPPSGYLARERAVAAVVASYFVASPRFKRPETVKGQATERAETKPSRDVRDGRGRGRGRKERKATGIRGMPSNCCGNARTFYQKSLWSIPGQSPMKDLGKML